jgi:hypothetical protein
VLGIVNGGRLSPGAESERAGIAATGQFGNPHFANRLADIGDPGVGGGLQLGQPPKGMTFAEGPMHVQVA